MTELKHITISPENYQKLKDLGKTADSFNDVVTKLLEQNSGSDKIK